jgi:polysaccharide biosynthesis/export protein
MSFVMRMRSTLVLSFIALSLAGCKEAWEVDGPSSLPGGTGVMADHELAEGPGAVSSITPLPTRNRKGAVPPYAARGEAAAYEYEIGYRVGSGDRLAIRIAGEADLTGEYVVDPTGNISLPYVQNLIVAGQTTSQIESHIAEKLKSGFLRNPQVSVQVTTLRPFYILGEVNGAGSFPYQAGMTVQNAIAIAGGYAPRADKHEVLLTRRNIKGTETYRVPVTTQVYPGDVIYIRERWL